jgi:hypothetical protein
MTTFKIFCHRYPVSGILCPPEWALDDERNVVNVTPSMPIPLMGPKWHKLNRILFHRAKKIVLA